MFTFNDAIVGSFLSGTNWDKKSISGKITAIFPGIGFIVANDFYTYVIIDNFKQGEKKMKHHIETFPSDSAYMMLSRETVLFWMNGCGYAKSKIYGKEVRENMLINPFDQKGLNLSFKVAPIIRQMENLMTYPEEFINFYLTFGTLPNCDRGDYAPIALDAMASLEEKRQMDAWHLQRAKLGIEDKYEYHFLECGKKLRVELNGEKISLIHFNDEGIHRTPYASPALNFVLKTPEFVGLNLEEKTWNLKNLSIEQLYEGIEAAYWEMRRLRNFTNNPSYNYSIEWSDAAWDEIDSRYEE